MSAIAPALQEYFTQRLIGQRQASPHTVTAYRDCFRLLFAYLAQTSGKQPAELGFEDLDADTISGFLTHLEKQRGVSTTTRNASGSRSRLAAIPSTRRSSRGCSRSRPSAATGHWSASWSLTRPTRC
jgi:integrase/recombinase XerD